MIPRLLAVLMPACCATAIPAEWVFDANGRLTGITAAGEEVVVQGNLRLPNLDWSRQPSLDNLQDRQRTEEAGVLRWTGRLEAADGAFAQVVQTFDRRKSPPVLEITVTAEADLELTGVYWWLELPIPTFAGGACELSGGQAAQAAFPVEQPANRHFLRADASRLVARDPDERVRLDIGFDRPLNIGVQDNREFGGRTYAALVGFGPALKKGETAKVSITLAAEIQPDLGPAALAIDAAVTRYRFDGFGGNYCFGIESPVTQYTLNNLTSAWARTEMTPGEWEPENDNADAAATDLDRLAANDKPDTNLRREFLLAQQIQRKGIPYVISIWRLPEWLYSDPGKGPNASRRKVDPNKWPELLECLGSYLLYAKRQYGVEPDLFSFNESDIGVRVRLTAEEHRDTIKLIGAHFAKLGLKTKMLLGDTGNARNTHRFCLPTADDPEALKYVGAISFHSWGGATPEQYGAWADLAERLNLPLLVGELGVDAAAWQTRSYDSFSYAVREVQHYQELLLHARPRGTMQWEFTNDYSLVAGEGDALTPKKRFYFVKQFCNLTPYHSRALGVASEHPKVLITAFADDQVTTVHIANPGAERQATLTGLPTGTWRAVRTSETEDFAELPAVEATGGVVTLTLAAQSLVTLRLGEDKP